MAGTGPRQQGALSWLEALAAGFVAAVLSVAVAATCAWAPTLAALNGALLTAAVALAALVLGGEAGRRRARDPRTVSYGGLTAHHAVLLGVVALTASLAFFDGLSAQSSGVFARLWLAATTYLCAHALTARGLLGHASRDGAKPHEGGSEERTWLDRVLLGALLGAALGLALGRVAPDVLHRRSHPEPAFGRGPATLDGLLRVPCSYEAILRAAARADKTRSAATADGRATPLWNRAATVWVEHLRADGVVEGPVASWRVLKGYVNRNPWPPAGVEVRERVATPACAALHDLWITEGGVRLQGAVREVAAARRAYDANKVQTKDPGLLEFAGEGAWDFSLYPVLPDGQPKEACYEADALLEPDANGWVELSVATGELAVRRLELDVTLHEPRGVAQFDLPDGVTATPAGASRWHLAAQVTGASWPAPDLKLRWRLDLEAPPAGEPCMAVHPYRVPGGLLVQVSGVAAGAGGPTVSLLTGRDAPGDGPIHLATLRAQTVDGKPGPAVPVLLHGPRAWDLDVPPAVMARLRAVAELSRAWSEEEPVAAVARATVLALRHRMASPVTSLYAAPGAERDDAAATVFRGAAQGLGTPLGPRPAEGRAADGIDLGLGVAFEAASGLVGGFRRARERANSRACVANQRTLAGSLEMFVLDFDGEVEGGGATPPRPAPGVLLGRAWRPLTKVPGRAVYEADGVLRLAPLVPTLLEHGYLQSRPTDPGLGAASVENYVLQDGCVTCRVHGHDDAGSRALHMRCPWLVLGLLAWALWRLGARAPGRLTELCALAGFGLALLVAASRADHLPCAQAAVDGLLGSVVGLALLEALASQAWAAWRPEE